MEETDIKLFEGLKVRRVWDKKTEKWFFSVVDIIAILTDQVIYKKAQSYWTTLKNRLKEEGSEVVTKCDKLKLKAADGKFYKTDAADTETLFRIIQSVPSKKAEPFKLWLAKVGQERIEEMNNPEKALDRSRQYWQKMGRPEKWIQQRMMGQETRNKLTDYWNNHGVKEGKEYAILTNIIHQEWSGLKIGQHKKLKGLKSENLRDHMSDAELIFTALAELSTRQIAENEKADGFLPNKSASKKGGGIAKNARKELEQETGKKIVTGDNFKLSNNERKQIED